MSALEKALALAVAKHAGTRDKGGVPYILHPIHVMMEMKKAGCTEDELAAGVMHDLVEDTDVTLDFLRTMFSEAVVLAVDSVTKREGEPIDEYRRRVATNQTGRKIKIHDLKHNMDITRLKNRSRMTDKDVQRLREYAEHYDMLVGGAIGV